MNTWILLGVLGLYLSQRKKSNPFYGESALLIPPPPSEEERVNELSMVQHQYHNRVVPEYLQQAFDETPGDVFNDLLISEGIRDQRELIRSWNNAVIDPVLMHKLHFNKERPHRLAERYRIPFKHDLLKTTETPSYPSGHTTQAYFVALKLSEKYPYLKDRLFHVARLISSSRLDRGVHFPSDLIGGKLLANALFNQGL